MSTVQKIEAAIVKLKPQEIRAVAEWLDELREEIWDRQIEADAKAGKLDKIINRAKNFRAEKSKKLASLQSAKGLWKNRKDLHDLRGLRGDLNRK